MASSHRTGGTSIQPPHYQSFASSNELLPRLAPLWHNPQHDHSLWHSSDPSSALSQQQRDAPHGGVAAECAHHQSAQLPWPASSIARYASSGWFDDAWGNDTVSRSTVQSSDASSYATVPHVNRSSSQQHHRAPNPAHGSSPNEPEHVSHAFQQLEIRHPSMGYPASSAPPFVNTTQKSAIVAHSLNQPVHSSMSTQRHPMQPMQPSLQSQAGWPSSLSSAVTQGSQQHTNPLAYSSINPTEQQWSFTSGAEISVPLIYESGWSPHDNGQYRHHNHSYASVSYVQDRDRPPASPPSHRRRNTPANVLNTQRAMIRHRPKLPKMAPSMTARQPKSKVSRRKGQLPQEKKQKAALMRKEGICIRCKLYKTACDDGTPCLPCAQAGPGARSYYGPCSRHNLPDANFVRRCNGRLGQAEAAFLVYQFAEDSSTYELFWLWNLPGAGPIPQSQAMSAKIQQYLTDKLDTTRSVWKTSDGEIKQLVQPPYAVTDNASMISFLENYFLHYQPAYERWLLGRIQHDELALRTYKEAMRLRNNGSKILRLALLLQCFSIASQGYGTVLSNNIPGINEVDYKRMGHSEYEAYNRDSRERPLPTAITHSIDVSVLKVLKKLEKELIKALTDLIFKPKLKPWYELFLTFFVLFWNLDYIHHGAQSYSMSKSGTSTEVQVSSVVTTQIARWDMTYPILMQYWPAISRGFTPFTYTRHNPEELRKKAPQMDDEGFDYWMSVTAIFDRAGPNRHIPPVTGHAFTHHSMFSEWIMKLFSEAGA